MTLIEEFDFALWHNTESEGKEIEQVCEIIAKDFALGFAEWLMDNCELSEDKSLYSYGSEDYSNKKLLEIYIKEKGL